MNVEFRGVIHFCWLRRLSPQETLTEMTDAYRQDCPSLPMIYKWYKEFEHGRKNLNDLPRVGRPISQEIRNHIKRFIDNFPSSSIFPNILQTFKNNNSFIFDSRVLNHCCNPSNNVFENSVDIITNNLIDEINEWFDDFKINFIQNFVFISMK